METIWWIIGSVAALLIVGLVLLLTTRRKKVLKLSPDEYNVLYTKKKIGQYELRSFLSRGSFTTTFEAVDTETGEPCAVRLLKRELIYTPEAEQQFAIKADILGFFAEKCPDKYVLNNIKLTAEAIDGERRPFIVTEYLTNAATLDDVLENKGSLNRKEVFEIVNQLSVVISAAHVERVWIRELHPRNVILAPLGNAVDVVLADVGIDPASLPFEESVTAKRGYYAPEELEGGRASAQSDVYALAALVFRLLEGRVYEGGSVDSALGTALRTALSLNPEARQHSVGEFVQQLATDWNLSGQQKVKLGKVVRSISVAKKKSKPEESLAVVGKITYPDSDNRDPNLAKNMAGRALSRLNVRITRPHFSLRSFFPILLLGIGRKLEKFFSKPSKLIIFLLLLLIIIGVLVWYFYIVPIRGELIISVHELSLPPYKKLTGVPLVIEARDKSSQALIKGFEFITDRFDQEEPENVITLPTNFDGTVRVRYWARFDPKEVLFVVRVLTDSTVHERKFDVFSGADSAKKIVKNYYVHPMRTATVQLSVKDLPTAFAGDRKPTAYRIEVAALDPSGVQLKDQSFSIDGVPMINGTAVRQFSFKNQVPVNVSAHIPDSSKIVVTIKSETKNAPKFDFDMREKRFHVVRNETFVAEAPLKYLKDIGKKGGGGGGGGAGGEQSEPTQYEFMIRNSANNKEMANVVVVIDGAEQGVTGNDGKLPWKTIENPEGFWQNPSKIRLFLKSDVSVQSPQLMLRRPRGESTTISLRFNRETGQLEFDD